MHRIKFKKKIIRLQKFKGQPKQNISKLANEFDRTLNIISEGETVINCKKGIVL